MPRSQSDEVTYPSLPINRSLYFEYMSNKDRPKPAVLLELAMCAYLNIESGKEVSMRNALEFKQRFSDTIAEQEAEKQATLDEIARIESEEKAAKERKFRLKIREALIMCHVKTPPFRMPNTPAEISYNDRLCKWVKDRLFDRHQIQATNVSDDVIIDTYYEYFGGENSE